LELVSVAGISLFFVLPGTLKAFKDKIPACTTSKCDVYSFSMVLYALITRRNIFDQKLDIHGIVGGKRPVLNL
jgi:hypothetical protein